MPVSITKPSHSIASAWMNLSIRYKGGAVIAIPVACLLLAVLGLVPLHREEETAERLTSRTQQIQLDAGQMLGDLLAAESGVRGYVITHDPSELIAYHKLRSSLPESLNRLRALVSDPMQSVRLLGLERLTQQRSALAGFNIAFASALLPKKPGSTPAPGLAETILLSSKVTEALRKKIQIFIDGRRPAAATADAEAAGRTTPHLDVPCPDPPCSPTGALKRPRVEISRGP